jgi:hypothetical protein
MSEQDQMCRDMIGQLERVKREPLKPTDPHQTRF